MTDVGAGMVGALAATLPRLRTLRLGMNRITDVGVQHMQLSAPRPHPASPAVFTTPHPTRPPAEKSCAQ